MGFHDRAVDQIKIVVRFRRQRVESPLPDPASRPPVEAIVSRRVGPILLGQITPRHPRAQHLEYCVHYPSIVHPATLPTARHERLQQSPLLVTQIKPHDPPPTTVNHDPINLSSNYLGTNPSSGHFLVPDSPYFIGLFLCDSDPIGEGFRGRYFQAGGRYICIDRATKGKEITTDFPIA